MASTEPIILYDIPGNDPLFKAWSLNTWCARFALNIKELPYKTIWIEYPDIEALCIKIGALPSSTDGNGEPYYTLPVIYDPSTKRVITESLIIVQYLDAQYPSTPRLIPKGTKALMEAFRKAMVPGIKYPFYTIILFPTLKSLNESSKAFFRATRQVGPGFENGETLEDKEIKEGSEEMEQKLKVLEGGFKALGEWMDMEREDERIEKEEEAAYVMGKELSLADVLVASSMIWVRTLLGRESQLWKAVMSWHNGRWERFMKRFEQFENIL